MSSGLPLFSSMASASATYIQGSRFLGTLGQVAQQGRVNVDELAAAIEQAGASRGAARPIRRACGNSRPRTCRDPGPGGRPCPPATEPGPIGIKGRATPPPGRPGTITGPGGRPVRGHST